MTVCLDVACYGDENTIYGISNVDNKVYECNLQLEESSVISELPQLKDKWFSINYCNEKIFLTTTGASEIYMISLKDKKIQILDWKNDKEPSWGFFVISNGGKIFFFYRNPFYVTTYDTEKDNFYDTKLNSSVLLDKIENISVYENLVALYNLSQGKIIILDLQNESVVNNINTSVKIENLEIVKDRIYIISYTQIYILDLYGNIIHIIDLPERKYNKQYFFLDDGDEVGIFNCVGKHYILRDGEKLEEVKRVDRCLTPIAPVGKQILKRIFWENSIETKYWLYDKTLKNNRTYLFKLPAHADERIYKNELMKRMIVSRENREGVGDLEDYLHYIIDM